MSKPIPELEGKTWEELEILEHESGRLMFADKLRHRNKTGGIEEIPVAIWVPTAADSIQARVEARGWFAGLKNLDPVRDAMLFNEMEQICLLARAIRTAEPPHSQFMPPEDLANYAEPVLHDIQERINIYKRLLDPRDSVTDEQTFWEKTIAVARRANLLPLADIAGNEQPSFIVRMASEACRSPRAQPWLQSLGISMPAASPSQN